MIDISRDGGERGGRRGHELLGLGMIFYFVV